MKSIIKKLIQQKWINLFYHLPKAVLANTVYGFPAKKLRVIGITGTDGKTTTTNLIRKVLTDAGKKVSFVSTINAVIAGKEYDTGFHVTSPDPFLVQKFASEALKNGDEFLVLEVTSHALDQFRFWGINFEVGVITNVTHDHLDYHKNWFDYLLTKAKLIKNVKLAVLNKDGKYYAPLTRLTKDKVVSFGIDPSAQVNPQTFPLNLKLPGEYNLANALGAAAVCSYLGIEKEVIKKSLESFESLNGRFEVVKNNRNIKVVVDFAHTPNALESVLKALKTQNKKGRIISVFGAAGERDVSKRPLMGKVAQKLSDIVVITAEDPRGHLEVINQQIAAGAKQAGGIKGKNLFIVNNRADAIEFAINTLAKKGDVVGIFGKGHEKSLNMDGKREIPWSDVEMAKRALWMKN